MAPVRTTITNWLLALAAIALAFMAQGYFRHGEVTDALIVYAIAAGLFLWAMRGYRNGLIPAPEPLTAPAMRPSSDESQGRAKDLKLLGAGTFIVAVVANLLALRQFHRETDLSLGWALYLLSMGAFLISVYLSDADSPRADSSGRTAVMTRREGLLLLLIVGIGAFMRFYRFHDWPFGTWYDEADNALHVLAMMKDATYRPIFVPSTNLPAHFLYLLWFAFQLFGPTTQSLRVVTALMGLGTVVAAYLFGREYVGRSAALILAFFLAVSRWNVTFSRIALHGISTPLFELLVLYSLLRALRTHRRVDFAWAGLLTGLGLCFYAPFRLFPLVIIVFLLHYALRQGRAFWQEHGVNLALLGVAGLIAFSPVIQYAADHPEAFWSRTDKVSLFRTVPRNEWGPALWKNTQAHLLMFNYKGDPNGRHNLPGEPMLDYATSALAVLGLAFALGRLSNPRYSLLVAWFAIMLCGGIFSLVFEAPQSLRAIGALPAVYVLACLPLALVRRETLQIFPRAGDKAFRIMVVPLLIWAGWSNYYTYFHLQARNYSSWLAYSTVETVMAEEINRLDPGYDMYFSEVLTNHLTTLFLAPRAGEQTPFDPARHLPFQRSGRAGVAVFLDKESLDRLDLLRFYYPGMEVRHFSPPFGGPEFMALALIDRAQIEGIQGLPARYYQEGGDIAAATYRQDKFLSFVWPQDAPLDFPFRVEWRGVLAAPTYGRYGFAVDGPAAVDVEVRLDGARLLGREDGLEREVMLARGRHDLRISLQVNGPGRLEFRWRPPTPAGVAGKWTVVPPQVLFGPPVTANGLVGSYYPNDQWAAPPELVRIDPQIDFYFHLIPLKRPYTVEWQGYLDIPAAGFYIFGVDVRDAAYLYVDDKLVLVNERADSYYERSLELAAGRHAIRLRYADRTDHSHIYLYWIPPGGAREIVPYHYLSPPIGGGWQAVE